MKCKEAKWSLEKKELINKINNIEDKLEQTEKGKK